jgi:hypothetical protein
MNLSAIYVLTAFLSLTFFQRVQAWQTAELFFSHERGFYTESFQLTVSAEGDIDSIWYTFDSRDPTNSPATLRQNNPAVIEVNPLNVQIPQTAPGVIVRALGIKDGVVVTPLVTHSFIFPDKIKELSPDGLKPGPNWPDTNSVDTTRQFFDYGLDPDILNDPRYTDQITDALLDIPSLSIVTAAENLFDPDTGIYVNAYGDGVEWERKCSLELIHPNGDEGFMINAGIRIRGGDSRRHSNPKHSFRFLFKQQYGQDQLKYRLFGIDGAAEFDRIDLRTNQNYSWHASDPYRAAKNTFVRETFSRDTQRDMGLPYTRSRQYHVYLNGVYWGLYMTQERPEANYGESYFGGSESDYDVIKIDKSTGQSIYATDGTTDSWQRLFDATRTGLSSNEAYFQVQGMNSDGLVNEAYEKLLDLENFISYLLIYYYVGNYDGIVGLEWNNQKPNNFWAMLKKSEPDGFKFFAHDAEQSMASEDGVTLGLNVNRLGPYEQLGEWYWFNGQELHQELVNNPEYLVTFADYVYKYFYNEGVLTPQNSIVRFFNRAMEINKAVIGESARWGDGNADRKHTPRTKDDDWLPALNDILTKYLPYRRDIVVQQLKNNNWYPSIDPPLFMQDGDTLIHSGFEVLNHYQLDIVKPLNGSDGLIVYTLDNSDPRAIGGEQSAQSLSVSGNISIQVNETTTVKARLKRSSEWSALHAIKINVFKPESPLIFSEIHYNPLGAEGVANDDFEFLEIKNIGDKPFKLGNATFEDGIRYSFPKGTIIESGAFIVLASNATQFKKRYGFYPYGQYTGRLDNDGEEVVLSDDSLKTLISVIYDDNINWPPAADGQGYSLTTKYPNDFSDPSNYENWTSSNILHGTPGRDDTINFGSPVQNIISDYKLYPNYPNPFNSITTIKYHVPDFVKVTIEVYNMAGQKIAVLVDEVKPRGIYNAQLNAQGLSSGMYLVQIKAGNFRDKQKLMLIK